MDFNTARIELTIAYQQHDAAVADIKQAAVCRAGCSYCCTHYGRVDTTTLEGLVIRERLQRLPTAMRIRLARELEGNRRAKLRGGAPRCPFLGADDTCRIYEVRPFSCRQLYSLKPCAGSGPTVHRQAVVLARAAVGRLQALDPNGYSGHLSYILTLLDDPKWRAFYLSGGFDPVAIMAFGKTHGLVINRMASGPGNGACASHLDPAKAWRHPSTNSGFHSPLPKK